MSTIPEKPPQIVLTITSRIEVPMTDFRKILLRWEIYTLGARIRKGRHREVRSRGRRNTRPLQKVGVSRPARRGAERDWGTKEGAGEPTLGLQGRLLQSRRLQGLWRWSGPWSTLWNRCGPSAHHEQDHAESEGKFLVAATVSKLSAKWRSQYSLAEIRSKFRGSVLPGEENERIHWRA